MKGTILVLFILTFNEGIKAESLLRKALLKALDDNIPLMPKPGINKVNASPITKPGINYGIDDKKHDTTYCFVLKPRITGAFP